MQNEVTLDLKKCASLIGKRKWFIILITLITTISAAIYSYYLIKPTYESSISMIIVKQLPKTISSDVKYDDVAVDTSLTKTYSQIAISKAVALEASKKLNSSISAGQINSSVSVSTADNSQILVIKSVGTTPEEAYSILNVEYKAFEEQLENIFPLVRIDIIDEAEVNDIPVKGSMSSKIANTVAGFFAGLIVSIVLVFFMNYFSANALNDKR